VTVNAVTPGFITTDMLATIPDQVLDRITGQIPVGRPGRSEEIARVVCFLAADQSAYITGQIWAVNGGMDILGETSLTTISVSFSRKPSTSCTKSPRNQ